MTTKIKKHEEGLEGEKLFLFTFDINVLKKIEICTYVLAGGRRPLGRHEKK